MTAHFQNTGQAEKETLMSEYDASSMWNMCNVNVSFVRRPSLEANGSFELGMVTGWSPFCCPLCTETFARMRLQTNSPQR